MKLTRTLCAHNASPKRLVIAGLTVASAVPCAVNPGAPRGNLTGSVARPDPFPGFSLRWIDLEELHELQGQLVLFDHFSNSETDSRVLRRAPESRYCIWLDDIRDGHVLEPHLRALGC